LNRIHLEEDAGKSLHDEDELNTCIDFNRAGTPLIEIVTEPDIRSSDEAFAYLTAIRKLVRYLGICDGNMEEGSLRCDANISVRKKGETRLGTRVEIKNLNSIRNVKKAIEAEAERLIGLTENGEPIIQQTRSFDAGSGTTFAIRDKEEADDYRYFADPDLTPFLLQPDFIESIRKSIPLLHDQRIHRYINDLQLSSYDANVITEEKETADYFEEVIQYSANYKAAANWIIGPVKNWQNETNKAITDFPLKAEQLAQLIGLVEKGKLSFTIASTKIFNRLLADPYKNPEDIARQLNLLQESDVSAIGPIIDKVLEKFADKVSEYNKGKKGLLSFFIGEVMKQTKGKADPKLTNDLVLEKLKSK
jgi:aspartyl-tRNA(Asn)/glutamyl-tRNA(Gln) amidotransferase subunit B